MAAGPLGCRGPFRIWRSAPRPPSRRGSPIAVCSLSHAHASAQVIYQAKEWPQLSRSLWLSPQELIDIAAAFFLAALTKCCCSSCRWWVLMLYEWSQEDQADCGVAAALEPCPGACTAATFCTAAVTTQPVPACR